MLFLVLYLAFSSSAFSESSNIVDFNENMILRHDDCKTTLVNMQNGKILSDNGDKLYIICEKSKPAHYSCLFQKIGEKKPFTSRNMLGGIVGAQGVLKSDGDEIIFSMISKKFIAESKVVIESGRLRGRKICSGSFFFESELNRKK